MPGELISSGILLFGDLKVRVAAINFTIFREQSRTGRRGGCQNRNSPV
jgi:hypothetical protein